MAASSLRELARIVAGLDKRVRALGSSNQLAYSSIESGSIKAYEGDTQTMQIGRQWDGTYAPGVTNGPTPPTPTPPVNTDGAGSFVVAWDGQFANAAILPMDFLRVDIHIGASSDFIPDHNNRFGSISAPTGGSVTVGAVAGTYYVKLVCWTLAGKVSDSTIAVPATSAEAGGGGTDGDAPASSPAPEVLSGIEALYVRWTPIANADPVTYEVHISTTTGFTPDSTTKAGDTVGSIFTIKALPGPAPVNPGDPDPRKFDYDTVYYVKIIARDDDGAAAPSTEASGNVIQIPAGSLAADTVTAREVVAGSFTGEEFSGEVFIGSQFKTADAGQRLEWGINGIQQYRSDETRRFYVPPTDDEDVYIDAQVKARGLQVVGGASFEGTQNSIEKDGAMRLASGVSSSSINTPQASVYYDSIRFNMPAGATPTGSLGTFVLNPTEVNSIAWTPASKVKVYQYRANQGTRVWQFDPITGNYENHFDYPDYEIMNETWNPSDPSQGYMLFRWMPDANGGKNGLQYYVKHVEIFNKYSRAESTRFPTIGWVGSNFFVAEVIVGTPGKVQIRQYSATLGPTQGNLPAPLSTIQTSSALSYLAIRPQVLFGNFAGGVGGNRYTVSENGGAANIYSFDSSGNWLLDDQFEAPTTKRGILYDGSNFWTYGNDGFLYKHTNFWWNQATSSKLWTQLTLRDGVGTTHETTPGPTGSLTLKRRANIKVTFPDLPFAGTGNPDDPDRWVFYAARGATQPANSGMWKQSEALDGVTQTIYSSLATTGTNPPTTNNFPGATPGEIRNDSLALRIKGDGSILGASVVAPVIKVGADLATGLDVQVRGPFYRGSSNTGLTTVSGTYKIMSNWTVVASSGITVTSGSDFTLPLTGQYFISAGIGFPSNSTGLRWAQLFKNGTSVALGTANGANNVCQAAISREISATAGDVINLRAFQNSGVNLDTVAGDSFTYIQIKYIGT